MIRRPMWKTPPLLISLLALAICLITACGPQTDASADTVDLSEPELDAAEIAEAFERDEAGATRSYSGKRIRIAGYVSTVEERESGGLTITLKTSQSTFRPVRCVMEDDDLTVATDLEPGMPISVSGRVAGFSESTYYVLLENCRAL